MEFEKICVNCMKERESIGGACPHCGFDESKYDSASQVLPLRTILNAKYLVGTVLGEGGFGITYIGLDLNLELRVAIKEYYPNGYAYRNGLEGNLVRTYSGEKGEYFNRGREAFIKEARNLAKFISLPGIVSVNDFFKENETAYIVMEYLDGKTLKRYLEENNGRITTNTVLGMMKGVMRSLGQMHNEGIIHRDISPDNIMIMQDGNMKLLDFGGARNISAESGGKSLSIMLKPGYAPEEQYRTHGNQGAWTDVYALAATIYRCITGIIPQESLERAYQDRLKKPSSLGIDVPSRVELVLMQAMAVHEEERFQNMEAFYNALYFGEEKTPVPQHPRGGFASIMEKNKNLIMGILGAVLILGGISTLGVVGIAPLLAAKKIVPKIETESTMAKKEPGKETVFEYGNTMGNINLFGYAVQAPDGIYFSDDVLRTIYKTNSLSEEAEVLNDDGYDAWSLNVSGDYLYFLSYSEYDKDFKEGTGRAVYRMEKDGSNLEKLIVLKSGQIAGKNLDFASMLIVNSKIYLSISDLKAQSGNIFVMDLDGENQKLLVKTKLFPADKQRAYFDVEGNNLYYSDANKENNKEFYGICRMDLLTGEKKLVSSAPANYLVAQGDWIYYLDAGANKYPCRVTTEGKDSEVLCELACENLNVIGEDIFMGAGNGTNEPNKIYKCNPGSGKYKLIKEYAKNPNVIEDGILYLNSEKDIQEYRYMLFSDMTD